MSKYYISHNILVLIQYDMYLSQSYFATDR